MLSKNYYKLQIFIKIWFVSVLKMDNIICFFFMFWRWIPHLKKMDYSCYLNLLSSTLTFKMLACLFSLIFFLLLFPCPVSAAVYQDLTLSLPPFFLKNIPPLGWNQHTEYCPQSLQATIFFPWLFWHFCLDITPFTNWQDPNYNHFLSYKPVSWHQYCLSCYSFTTLSHLILFIFHIHLDIKSCHFFRWNISHFHPLLPFPTSSN